MRSDRDYDMREEEGLDPRRMAFLLALVVFLLFVPFMLHTVGIIKTWLMSVLFIPGVCLLFFVIHKYRIRS